MTLTESITNTMENIRIYVCLVHYLVLFKNSDNKHCGLVGLVSLFNGISTFVGYLMPKTFS